MIIKKIIRLPQGLEINFGIPDNQAELNGMFSLRHKVYVEEKKYIPAGLNDIDQDIDEHDKNKECTYFIAKIGDNIVGTTRTIKSAVLPTEKDYFYFDKPNALIGFKPDDMVEIGRIISRPHQFVNDKIPRGIVMMGLMFVMVEFAKENGIFGGFGSIKKRAFEKLKNNGIPMHLIKKYKPKFDPENSNDPLKNFFNKEDPVIPLYFIVDEVAKYFERVFNRSKFFENIGYNIYLFKDFKMNFMQKIIFRLNALI